ncbi:cyclodeaminase [Puniceibacterium sp. IMCC21224]|uniref:cyclodeaminase n=1 Tax=Puniceibacterium sp. IMCC21224 TaxID=1618204 RepID=UPI00064DEA67|nr:cyclodeaminase [Puniceibacterium sp. IMCC21224]KMK65892.1 putative ornithine cyclodeaminase, mu-crystallin [Puniceibacterium sp. IMCC21224]
MPDDIRILTEADLRKAVTLDLGLVDVIERAFVALAQGGVVMPPVLSMDLATQNGEVDIKTACIPGFDSFAIKISTGFFGNAALGLPSLSGLMVVFSAHTGQVRAVLLDNGYLTDLRTAAAGAVAARHLAPADVSTAGVIGTGLQARLQMQAAHLVRPFTQALVWGRDADKAALCADDLSRTLGIPAQAVVDAEELVMRSQLVITTTPARAPVLQAEWLHPGLHVTAMGADAPDKNEIAPQALVRADLYAADRLSQVEVLGEFRSALAAGLWTKAPPPELGTIIVGQVPGRVDQQAITIADLTGTGAQDTAIASHVLGQSVRIDTTARHLSD